MNVCKKENVQCYGNRCIQCFPCKKTLQWENVCFSEHGFVLVSRLSWQTSKWIINFVSFWNKGKILWQYEQTTHLIQIASYFRAFPMIWNVASARDDFSLRRWSGGTAHLRTFRGSIGCKTRVLLAAMLLFHWCFFSHIINQGWTNLFNRRVNCRKSKTPASRKTVCNVKTNMAKNASFTWNDVQELSVLSFCLIF